MELFQNTAATQRRFKFRTMIKELEKKMSKMLLHIDWLLIYLGNTPHVHRPFSKDYLVEATSCMRSIPSNIPWRFSSDPMDTKSGFTVMPAEKQVNLLVPCPIPL
jgi:hypothetical protein